MKLEIVKYQNDAGEERYKITKDGSFINVYFEESEAVTAFEKLVTRLQEPKLAETIIKSVEI